MSTGIHQYSKGPHEPWGHEPHYTKTPTKVVLPPLPTLFSDNFFLGFADQIERWQNFTTAKPSSFPPYNIIKEDDDNYRVELAVAGYSKSDVDITVERDQLIVASAKTESDDAHYVHQGIAERSWRQTFILGEYMVVKDAVLKDGLLTISVERELPEEMKPKSIKIK